MKILNKKQLINNGVTPKQRKVRRDLCAILDNVLDAIDPYTLVQRNLTLTCNTLRFANSLNLDLPSYKNIYVVGAGKAVYKMALAVEELLSDKITSGCINVPTLPENNKLQKIIACKAQHPTPNIRGVLGTERIVRMLKAARKDDLIIAVMSGGGSALMPLPAVGITLKDKIALTSLLLKTPATINEINAVRKHLSQIKGGQFACFAYPATLVALYISDIVDNSFDVQASGPTAPDLSTFSEAIEVLKKYQIWDDVPASIRKRLVRGAQGLIPETPKPDNKAFCSGKIHNFTIASHQTAVEAAARAGKKMGYNCLELTSSLQGEACEIAKGVVAIGKHIAHYDRPLRKPALVVAGGETTVHVRGKGKGGRNQEFALSAIYQLRQGMTIVSFGTDGVDGITPIPVAGAMVDTATRELSLKKKLDGQKFLANNDAYHFFQKVGEHIHTGPTGTNVGDLILMAVV